MKIAITGTRTFTDYKAFSAEISKLSPNEIITGGAKGADSQGGRYANENNIPLKVFLPKFKTDKTVKYHPRWYLERNKEIVKYCDVILAFWDKKSKGTQFTINYAKKIGKQVIIFPI